MKHRAALPALIAATLVSALIVTSHAATHLATFGPHANGTNTGPLETHDAQPGEGKDLPDLDKLDPVRYSLKTAIITHEQVLSRDGVDKIWVDIIRPKTPPGVKVPTIMDMSPYYNTLGRGWVGDCKTPSSPSSLGAQLNLAGCTGFTAFPEWYANYFVPRGYAVAEMDLRGTRNTTGCQVYGDKVEVQDGVDTVDWITSQGWSSGKVGLTGGSYDGTMANGVAVEQPLIGKHKDAVTAVVPIRAIDRWYDYHFYNGVPSSETSATPESFTALYAGEDIQTQSVQQDPNVYTEIAERKACIASAGALTDVGYAPTYQDSTSTFWDRRNYVKDAHTTKAAFFLIHGLYDDNVMTQNVDNMWDALPASAPKKLWLEDASHADPDTPKASIATAEGEILPFPFRTAYETAVHRWWAQFLKGLPAGALQTPTVEVQQGDGSWLGSRQWPLPSTDKLVPLGTQANATYADGASTAPATQAFFTKPSSKAIRISGQIEFDLTYALTGVDTSFSVQIDDLPPGVANNAPVTDPVLDTKNLGAFTVSYAFARAAYAAEIHPRSISYPTTPKLIVPGASNTISFGSLPMDYTLKPGHRLRFTFGSGLGGSMASNTGGTVTLELDHCSIRLPVAKS